MVRHPAADRDAADRVLFALGELATERGTDAAGLAFGPRTWDEAHADPFLQAAPAAQVGAWTVRKTTGDFASLRNLNPDLDELAAAADIVLGHTRRATQGDADDLANASPLICGNVIGTHAGDLEARLLEQDAGILPVGETDSELLFALLSSAQGRISHTVAALESLRGRAVAIWIDQRWPGLLQIARTAITTVTIARDSEQNLFWATNPNWLRRAVWESGNELKRLWMVPEGTLLAIDIGKKNIRLADKIDFTATTRSKDVRLADVVGTAGFTAADRAQDRRLRRHRVGYGQNVGR